MKTITRTKSSNAMYIDRGLAYAELLKMRSIYRKFKAEHWNRKNNRMKTDCLDEYYKIIRAGYIARKNYEKSLTK